MVIYGVLRETVSSARPRPDPSAVACVIMSSTVICSSAIVGGVQRDYPVCLVLRSLTSSLPPLHPPGCSVEPRFKSRSKGKTVLAHSTFEFTRRRRTHRPLELRNTMDATVGSINIGNTAFMLLCSSLVMFMTPGLAFFYGGLVGRQERPGGHDPELRVFVLDDRHLGRLRLLDVLRADHGTGSSVIHCTTHSCAASRFTRCTRATTPAYR